AVEDAPIPGHEVHRLGAQAAVAHEFLDNRRPPLGIAPQAQLEGGLADGILDGIAEHLGKAPVDLGDSGRSEEHTSELQSRENLVCRLLLEKKKKIDRA